MKNQSHNLTPQEKELRKRRTALEIQCIMPRLSQAQELNKLPDYVDKSPASFTKYKSGGGSSYSINLNQPAAGLKKEKI